MAGVGSHERHNAGESAIEGQRKAGSRSQSPKGLARLTNAATPSMAPHSQANRALLRPSGVRTQGAVPTGTVPLALPCSGRTIAPACEVQFMRPDTGVLVLPRRPQHVTKRIAAITPPRALVVLRFLLNNPQSTLCFRPKLTTCSHPNSYTRSAETGSIENRPIIRWQGYIFVGPVFPLTIDRRQRTGRVLAPEYWPQLPRSLASELPTLVRLLPADLSYQGG